MNEAIMRSDIWSATLGEQRDQLDLIMIQLSTRYSY